MHVLLMPVGSAGDVHPMIGLGRALAARGHRITAVVNGYFRSLAEQSGFEIVEFGTREEYLELANHPDLWHPRKSFGYIIQKGLARFLRRQYETTVNHCRAGETLIVASLFGFGARIAQAERGLPLATVHLQPSIFWSDYESPFLTGTLAGKLLPRWYKRFLFRLAEKLVIDRETRPVVNPLLCELGLPPLKRTTDWWHSPECVLGLFPAWLAPPQPDWPPNVSLCDFPLWDEDPLTQPQPEVEQFLSAGTPPIVFTPGSAHMHAGFFFQAAADACQRLGRRGMLLTRFADQVPRHLPQGVRHFDYVPFSRLLPRAAAIVHHGGIGTCAQGLRAGLPQLIMPLSHDQPDNALRLRNLGVGTSLHRSRFDGPRVAAQLEQLLNSPDVAESCDAVAARFAGIDPFAKACRALEEYAAQRSLPTGSRPTAALA
jgi:UDP:flavonoid glycosyltransferase YjiC (YdhE family)